MERELTVFDIMPTGAKYVLVGDKSLPDQVKQHLANHFAIVANRIAFADLSKGTIYLIDHKGFAWKFHYNGKTSRWGFVSASPDLWELATKRAS